MDATQLLFRGDVFLQACDCAMGAFVARGEGIAIGGEKLGVGEEAAEHGDDALVKGEVVARKTGSRAAH